MEKPKWPIGSLLREGDLGPFCPKCYSSLKYKIWPFIRSKYCIQPDCENYYESERNEKMTKDQIENGYEEKYGVPPTESQMKKYDRSEEEDQQMGQKTAGRFSVNKTRFDLCAPWSMDQIAQVYTYGTVKYDDDNWWKGLKLEKQ